MKYGVRDVSSKFPCEQNVAFTVDEMIESACIAVVPVSRHGYAQERARSLSRDIFRLQIQDTEQSLQQELPEVGLSSFYSLPTEDV